MSEGDQFDRAVKCIYDRSPQADQYRDRAQSFVDQYKKNKNFWQLLFKKLLDPRTDAIVVFHCIQEIGYLINSGFYENGLNPNDQKRFRTGLMQWIPNSVVKKNFQNYIKNKYCQIIIILFSKEYLRTWKDFFHELFRFVNESHKRPQKEFIVILDMFLRILFCIDEDLFHLKQSLSSALLRTIKERMRQDCVQGLAQTWKKILDMKVTNLSKFCLSVMAKYIDWIDVKLMTRPDFAQTFYQLIQTPETRKESMEVFNALVVKGMPPLPKLQMIDHLKLIPLLKTLSQCQYKDERDYMYFGSLCNSVGLQILEGWVKIPDKTLSYRLLSSLLDQVLMNLVGVKNFKVVHKVLGFFREYVRVLIQKQKQLGRSEPREISQMKFLLQVIMKTTVYDNNFKFDLSRQEEGEAAFVQYRCSWFQVYEKIVEMMGKDIINFISPVMKETFANLQNVTFPRLEISLRLFYNCLDKYDSPEKNDPNEGFFRYVICEIIKRRVIRFNHQEVKKLYFDIIAKWGYLLVQIKNKQERSTLIKEVLEAFLGSGFASNNIQVKARCYRQFLKFIQAVRNIMLPFLDELTRRIIPFMKLVPEIPRQADEFGRHHGTNPFHQSDRAKDFKIDLYKAMGVLLSLPEMNMQKRVILLKNILNPVMAQVKDVMNRQLYRQDRREQPVFQVLLSSDILAMASLGKHFPKNGTSGKEILDLYQTVFSVVMDLFGALSHSPFVRREVCGFVKTLMPLYPHRQIVQIFSPSITQIFNTATHPLELAHVFSIIIQVMNFKESNAFPMVNSLMIPLTKKTLELTKNGTYLQNPAQVESSRPMLMCHVEYLDFLINCTVGKKGCYKAFFSAENGKHFVRVLEVVLQAVDANGDPFSRLISLGFKLLEQLILMAFSLQKGSGNSNNSIVGFVISKAMPVMLLYPLKSFVDISIAESVQNISKMSKICMVLTKEFGGQFRQFLNNFLPRSRLKLAPNEVEMFMKGMFSGDQRAMMNMFQGLYKSKKKF